MYKGRAWTCVPRNLSEICFSLIKETFQQWISLFIFCKAKFHVGVHFKCFWASLGVKWLRIYPWWTVSLVEKQRSFYWCCISLKQVTLFTWNVHVGWSGSEAVIVRYFIWSVRADIYYVMEYYIFIWNNWFSKFWKLFMVYFCPVLRVTTFCWINYCFYNTLRHVINCCSCVVLFFPPEHFLLICIHIKELIWFAVPVWIQ